MRFTATAVAIVAILDVVFVETTHVPQCLADCLKNTTSPCDSSSLGLLIACLDARCTVLASETTLMLSPQAEYSCQQSLVPGRTDESPSTVTVVGDSRCVTTSFDFKSFIPSTISTTSMDVLGKKCRLDIFSGQNCIGDHETLDLSALEDNKCVFHGGRSVRMQCHEPFTPNLNPYLCLEHMCANDTSASTNSSSPLPSSHGIFGPANSTVDPPSISSHSTAIASTALATYVSTSPNHAKTSSSSGLASSEQTRKPSIVALVAVVAAAILML